MARSDQSVRDAEVFDSVASARWRREANAPLVGSTQRFLEVSRRAISTRSNPEPPPSFATPEKVAFAGTLAPSAPGEPMATVGARVSVAAPSIRKRRSLQIFCPRAFSRTFPALS